MATFYGSNATKRDNTTPVQMIEARDGYGKLRVLYDEYTLTADLASADVINMAKIPANARVLDVIVAYTDLDASGGTIDVGWAAGATGAEAADDDGFIANADVATAADVVKMSDNLANGAGQFKVFSEEVQVQVKIDGDTDATSGTIKLAVIIAVE